MWKTIVSLALACVIGAGVDRALVSFGTVHAAEAAAGLQAFQVAPIGRDSAITVYDSNSRTYYVYPAINQGSSQINCEFMFRLSRAGGPMERRNCSPAGW
ncbi:hypothetical protein [Terriglobus aquaticus]|uniref:Uncharacterized protein n=1 Tax=Terriglobus aquaticus TaxID=940139 RepID=A0ABW9KHV1_9BACT|nr:hypothetical protein [Terriglobus aquaticus]